MKRILAAAAIAALIVACESGTGGRLVLIYDGGPLGLPPPTSADAGDAGTSDSGTDGGADAGDAGCTHQSFNGTAFDTCFSAGQVTASVIESSCTANLYLAQGTILCIGAVSGVNDAFDGGCQGPSGTLSCSSTSLPGTLHCDGGCAIVVCNAGACP